MYRKPWLLTVTGSSCSDNLEVFQKNGFEFKETADGHLALAAVPFRWADEAQRSSAAKSAGCAALRARKERPGSMY